MFDRRQFLAGTAAVATATTVMPRMAMAAERADVVIVGAGLSGMNAAMILSDLGMKVIVLDASDKVGGRVRTIDTADGPLDLGASQVGRGYARVIDMCQKLGLKLFSEDRDLLPFGAHMFDSWIDLKTWESNPLNKTVGDERRLPPHLMGQVVAGKLNPLKELDDWLNPKFASFDVSQRELMRRNGYSEAAIQLASYSVSGISIDDTSMLRMWQDETRGKVERQLGSEGPRRDHPFGEGNDHQMINGLAAISNIQGGTFQLPKAMAAKLGDVIRLGKRAQAISLTDTGGTVTCADGSVYAGRFIVSTLPFTMLRDVKITGKPNPIARAAINTMPYANTARMFLSAERPFWREDGLPASFSTDGPIGMFWAIDNHTGVGKHRAMVVMVGKVGEAISKMPPAQAHAFVMAELVRLRPAARGALKMIAYKDWSADPLQRGCGFSIQPGGFGLYAREMIKPWQVLHFAGEHTRRMEIGMESAMESGERVAIEISARA